MQINQYTTEATSVTDADWLDLDKKTGPGVFESQKLSLPVLYASILALYPEILKNIYNSDGILNDNRLVDGNGKNLTINNIDDLILQGNLVQLVSMGDGTGNHFRLLTSASLESDAAFYLVNFASAYNLLTIRGNGKIDVPYGILLGEGTGGAAIDSKLLLDVHSDVTNKAVRTCPRITETQRDALTSPLDYSEIINTTRGQKELYHPVFGWIGSTFNLSMGCSTTASITSTTYYFGAFSSLALRTSVSGLAMRPTKKCKIVGASFTRFISSTLGDRSYSLYVRINNTTDYLVATVGTTALESFFSNSAMNTTGIPVDVTDSIVMKLVVSGGTTDSTNVLFAGNLLIA